MGFIKEKECIESSLKSGKERIYKLKYISLNKLVVL